MIHLTHDSGLEIWVLEDGELPDQLFDRAYLSDLTEEQAKKWLPGLSKFRASISNSLETLKLTIDQLLKDNGLHGLRVGECPNFGCDGKGTIPYKTVNWRQGPHGEPYAEEEWQPTPCEWCHITVPPENIIVKI